MHRRSAEASRSTGKVAVRPVSGRRELRRFIDYAYQRNAADPHWIPPLRLSERERLAVRPLKVAEFAREVERLRTLYSAAWAQNWGFVPPNADECRRLAKELKPIFDPRCAICVEADGEMVACAVAIP